MRFLALLFSPLLLAPFVSAATGISFINPEPGGGTRNYLLNPSYPIGSSLLISWKSPSNSVSMVLYQEREGDQFEYVFTNSVNITSFRWNVGTQKNLTNGAVFFFQIFVTGETGPSATSRYFNLTRPGTPSNDDDDKTTTSSRVSSATQTSSMTISLSSTLSSTTTSAPSSTGTSLPADAGEAKSGLSTPTKIGLGVAIPLAVLALAILAFFLYRQRKSKAGDSSQDYTNNVSPAASDNKYTPPGDGSYAPNAMQEQNGGGYYKPGAPTEMYTPGVIGSPRSELGSAPVPAAGGLNGPTEVYTPPTGNAIPVAGQSNGNAEVHEMSGVRY